MTGDEVGPGEAGGGVDEAAAGADGGGGANGGHVRVHVPRRGHGRARVGRRLFGPADMAVVVKALAKGATVEAAAAEAGFGRTTLYEWRRISELFRNAWADAVKESARPMLVAATGQRRYQLRRMRRNAFDRERQLVFLEHFAATCDATASAEEAGVAVTTVMQKRLNDPVFADGWAQAVAQGYARLEAEAVRQRLQAAERIVVKGDKDVPGAGEEFERALKLLKEYKRAAGGPKTGRPPSRASLDESFEELERQLRAYQARRKRERGEE